MAQTRPAGSEAEPISMPTKAALHRAKRQFGIYAGPAKGEEFLELVHYDHDPAFG